ncbi:MAG: glycosyltransferase family 4 protein [Planctomycetia bacterium]|nr:glycosyltransferase family 4 protein [Candidatus Brocadia sp.]QOJ06232.1 MAG: glycosyltransferase family 4 protein [Planctomycetia bacterium]TVL94814.1 MAG: glycosyl transferase [Candidatus Brocadia sp. BL1]HQU32329.1 glycosyltransferase family 4 protein [Candidatus Brocadia sapporoensis]
MQNTRICHITTVHSSHDGRIFHKECKSLASAGYDVTLIAQHDKNETIESVKIIALPKHKGRFKRMLKLPLLVLIKAVKGKADVYHFHDPELIVVGLLLKFLGKKVIYDVHEDVPKQILNKTWVGSLFFRRVVAFFTHHAEQFGALFFDAIIAATPDIANKFNPSKTEIIRNLPILKIIDADTNKNCIKQKEKPIVIYAGGLTKIRGIKEIIQAMEYIGDRAELWLLGDWETDEFKKECENLEGWKSTKYFGRVPLNVVYQYMKKADIGISMLYPIKNYLTSLPVKAFEYMACSLPMIMSDFPYWQEIFGECALFADPHNPRDIAERILYLLNNPEKAQELGIKGRQLIESKYSWEAESKRLIRLYEKLLA